MQCWPRPRPPSFPSRFSSPRGQRLIPLARTLHGHCEDNGATTNGLTACHCTSKVRDTIHSEQGTSCCSHANFLPCWGKLGILNPGTRTLWQPLSAFSGEKYIVLAASQRRCLVSVPRTAGVPRVLRGRRLSSKSHRSHGCAIRTVALTPRLSPCVD